MDILQLDLYQAKHGLLINQVLVDEISTQNLM